MLHKYDENVMVEKLVQFHTKIEQSHQEHQASNYNFPLTIARLNNLHQSQKTCYKEEKQCYQNFLCFSFHKLFYSQVVL